MIHYESNKRYDTEKATIITTVDHTHGGNYSHTDEVGITPNGNYFLLTTGAGVDSVCVPMTEINAYDAALEMQPFTEKEEALVQKHFSSLFEDA